MEDTNRTEDPIIRKIRALLNQANGTSFEAEAEAFAAKAQALMDEYRITEAQLRDAGIAAGPIVKKDYIIPDPASRAFAVLLNAVCKANAVHLVLETARRGHKLPGVHSGQTKVVMFGTETAIAGVQMTYAHLRLQVLRELLRQGNGRRTGAQIAAYRRSFIFGFSARLAIRYRENAATQANMDGASKSGALVLVTDAQRAADAAREDFGQLQASRMSSSSAAGREAGYEAGGRADLGGRGVGGSRRALNA